MNWFRVDTDVTDHPKVFRLAEALGIDVERAIGKLIRFWSNVARYAESGNLMRISDAQIAEWFGWKKPAFQLATLLRDCGMFDLDTREVHGWKRRHQRFLNERERKIATAEKARKERGNAAENPREIRGKGEDEPRLFHLTTSPLLSSPSTSSPNGDVRDLFDRWNTLAAELSMATAEWPLNDDRKRQAKHAVDKGLLTRWDEFATALRGPAGAWHRGERLGFTWLIRRKLPWLDLIERHKAGPPASFTTNGAPLTAMLDRVFGTTQEGPT